MATEIITPLGELNEFDPFIQKMKEEAAGHQAQHSELLSSSALSTIGLKFEGKTYEVAKIADSKQTPFTKYSDTAKKSVQTMRAAQSIIEDEISRIQSSLPDEDHYSITNTSIRQASAKLKALEEKIAQYDADEDAAFGELSVLQKSLQDKQRDIFESKEKEYDRQIAEVKALEAEYNETLNQDDALLENKKLANTAFAIAEELKSIIEKNVTNRDSMLGEFSPKFDELLSEFQRSNLERFFEETQMIILQNVTGIIKGETDSIDREAFYRDLDALVRKDYVKIEAALSSLDVENEIQMITSERDAFIEKGAKSLINDDISKLQSEIAELEATINLEERSAMQKEKDSIAKRIKDLQSQLNSDIEKYTQGQNLIDKLKEFGASAIMHKLNQMNFDAEEISDLDESIMHINESPKQRERLIETRGSIATRLKEIDLHMDDSISSLAFQISVDIAASSDVDGLLILKSNYLKEKSRNLMRISHIEQQINKVKTAISNSETLFKYLDDTESLASEVKIQHKDIGTIDDLKKDLVKSKNSLEKKKEEILKIYADYKARADQADDRIDAVNEKISAFKGFNQYAAAQDLKENYRIHTEILKTVHLLVDSLVELEKDLKDAKKVKVAPVNEEEEHMDLAEDENLHDMGGESLAGIFDGEADDLNTSLADELAELGEGAFMQPSPAKPSSPLVDMQASELPKSKGLSRAASVKSVSTLGKADELTASALPGSNGMSLDKASLSSAPGIAALEGDMQASKLPKSKGLTRAASVKSVSTLGKADELTASALPGSNGMSLDKASLSSALGIAALEGDMQASELPKSKGLTRAASVKSVSTLGKADELTASALPGSNGMSLDKASISAAPGIAALEGDMQASELPKSKGLTRAASVKSVSTLRKADELTASALPGSNGMSLDKASLSAAPGITALEGDMQASELPKPKGLTRAASVKSVSMQTTSDELKASAIPASTGMDFASIMDLIGESPVQQVSKENIASQASAKAAQVSTPIVGKAVAAPMSQIESGALALDEGNVHASNPHIEERGFMPRHIDSGPTYSNKVYNLLATTINKSHASESAHHRSVAGVPVENVKPKTAELLGNMLTKQAGLEDKRLSSVGMSNVDGKSLDRLIARGEKPGSLLLWAMRQNMEVGLADLLNHIQVH